MSVGKNIKARRKELNMSAETLAEILGVSPSTIYRYESGDIEKVDSAKLIPIAEALKTSPAYLMGWPSTEYVSYQFDSISGKLHAIGDSFSALKDTEEWKILSSGLSQMSKDERQRVVAVVKAMFPDRFDTIKNQ